MFLPVFLESRVELLLFKRGLKGHYVMNTKRWNKIWGLGLNRVQQRAVLSPVCRSGRFSCRRPSGCRTLTAFSGRSSPTTQHNARLFMCFRSTAADTFGFKVDLTSWPQLYILYTLYKEGGVLVSPHFSTVSLPGPCTMWELYFFILAAAVVHITQLRRHWQNLCVYKNSEEIEGVTSEVRETTDRPRHYRSNSFHLPTVFYHLWIKHKGFFCFARD